MYSFFFLLEPLMQVRFKTRIMRFRSPGIGRGKTQNLICLYKSGFSPTKAAGHVAVPAVRISIKAVCTQRHLCIYTSLSRTQTPCQRTYKSLTKSTSFSWSELLSFSLGSHYSRSQYDYKQYQGSDQHYECLTRPPLACNAQPCVSILYSRYTSKCIYSATK